ncbi:MAG: hypothetical protein NTU58_03995 [Candidatus Nealsonbacteria bacterium]|nr:hypothetical protein [Candidatus Nealsonbacteria bacterium]
MAEVNSILPVIGGLILIIIGIILVVLYLKKEKEILKKFERNEPVLFKESKIASYYIIGGWLCLTIGIVLLFIGLLHLELIFY